MSERQVDFQKVQAEFTAHIRNPKKTIPANIEPRRMKIYTDLFFNNISDLLGNGFPVIKSLFDSDDWNSLIRQFMMEHQCHTPYFLELGQEFIAWLECQLPKGELPPFIYELAHYEWVEVGLDIAEEEADWSQIDTNGDLLMGVPVLSPLAWSLAYSFPVQLIGPSFQPSKPPAEPTYLIVYRNRLDKVSFTESNAATAALIEVLRDNEGLTGEQVMMQLAEKMNFPDVGQLTIFGMEILAKLQQLGIVLGAAR